MAVLVTQHPHTLSLSINGLQYTNFQPQCMVGKQVLGHHAMMRDQMGHVSHRIDEIRKPRLCSLEGKSSLLKASDKYQPGF